MFFPTGTVIAASKGRLPSVSLSSGRRVGNREELRTRALVCVQGATARAYRHERVGLDTVPVGKQRGSSCASPDKYRSRREVYARSEGVLPYPTGNFTVLSGKEYRSRREALPYPWGRNTVPVGNFAEDFSCKEAKNEKALRCACLC